MFWQPTDIRKLKAENADLKRRNEMLARVQEQRRNAEEAANTKAQRLADELEKERTRIDNLKIEVDMLTAVIAKHMGRLEAEAKIDAVRSARASQASNRDLF